MREYINSKLGERRFPIVCPVCAIDREQESPGGTWLFSDYVSCIRLTIQ